MLGVGKQGLGKEKTMGIMIMVVIAIATLVVWHGDVTATGTRKARHFSGDDARIAEERRYGTR